MLDTPTERVLYYLALAEYRETDPWFQCDIRIAWITVLYASLNYRQPHVSATYRVLGLHPDKVAEAIEARRRALLGPLYDQQFSKLPPKKPSTSVSLRKASGQGKASGE